MLIRNLLPLLLFASFNLSGQNFNDLDFGTDTTLEIVTWNIEWFPKSGQTTVTDVSLIIDALDADLIAVQEIDNKTSFGQMVSALNGWDSYFLFGEYQSLAYIYKESTIELIDVYEIFTDDWREFPRPPLVAEILYQGVHFIIINNHLKCCGDGVLNLADEWDEETRRYRACNKLEDYIQEHFSNDRVILLGDLNDILTDDEENNVFKTFLSHPGSYLFADMEIAQGNSNQWSYPNWPSHLDHLLISNELFNMFYNDGSEVLTIKPDEYYPGGMDEYDERVSDHRPVGIKFALPESFGLADSPYNSSSLRIFPNPANEKIYLHGLDAKAFEYTIYDISGSEVLSGIYTQGYLDVSNLGRGLYLLSIQAEEQRFNLKLIVN